MEKKVTIIIPTYNRYHHLKKAVQSVCSQNYSNWELIVVDDGSSDDTRKLIQAFQDKYGSKIHYIYQENSGPSSARNSGIRASKTEFVAFLDSDDWFDQNKLAIQVAAMEMQPDALISHTDELWYRQGKILNQKLKHRKVSGHGFNRCLEMCVVSISTTMVRQRFFDKFGCFDEDFHCCEDYDLWLRVSISEPFLLINQPLTYKDGGRSDQVSFIHRVGMDKFRIVAIEKILTLQLQPEQRQLALVALKKKCLVYSKGCIKHGRLEEGRYFQNLPLQYER